MTNLEDGAPVSVDVTCELVKQSIGDQTVLTSEVVSGLNVAKVEALDDVVGDVGSGVLNSENFRGQQIDCGLSVETAAKEKSIRC